MRRIGALFGLLHIHRIEINICANAIYSAIKYCVISRDNSPCDDHESPTRARGGLRENPTTWEAHPHPLVPPKLQTRATRRRRALTSKPAAKLSPYSFHSRRRPAAGDEEDKDGDKDVSLPRPYQL